MIRITSEKIENAVIQLSQANCHQQNMMAEILYHTKNIVKYLGMPYRSEYSMSGSYNPNITEVITLKEILESIEKEIKKLSRRTYNDRRTKTTKHKRSKRSNNAKRNNPNG